ncbi:Predicted thioesterase [Rhodospirillaceae bacterium LM-1]|nr:Predicted thioesterase [Rhodospirillaceae bacterium LM-1]
MTKAMPTLEHFPYRLAIPTRWSDNDMFGHINNVQYYRYYEAVILKFLADKAQYRGFDEPVLVFAAESQCRFLKPLSYPGDIVAALGVEHLGKSSVRYGLALFEDCEKQAAATGHWVHVFVDRATQRPVPIPEPIRAIFSQFQVNAHA